jgi:hypothetical protein
MRDALMLIDAVPDAGPFLSGRPFLRPSPVRHSLRSGR